MEGFNMNNLNNQNKDMRVVPGSEGWLGGIEMEKTPNQEDSSNEILFEQLEPGMGLDKLPYKILTPQKHFETMGGEGVTEKNETPEHLKNAADILFSNILKNDAAQGARHAWVDGKPDDKFVTMQGNLLKKEVTKSAPIIGEDKIVYNLLKNKVKEADLNSTEKAVGDAILNKAGSRYIS